VAGYQKLTVITLDFGEVFADLVQRLWLGLASLGTNATSIIHYLLSQGVGRRSLEFLNVGRRLASLLVRTQADQVVRALVPEFEFWEKVAYPEDALPPPDEVAILTAELALRAVRSVVRRLVD